MFSLSLSRFLAFLALSPSRRSNTFFSQSPNLSALFQVLYVSWHCSMVVAIESVNYSIIGIGAIVLGRSKKRKDITWIHMWSYSVHLKRWSSLTRILLFYQRETTWNYISMLRYAASTICTDFAFIWVGFCALCTVSFVQRFIRHVIRWWITRNVCNNKN